MHRKIFLLAFGTVLLGAVILETDTLSNFREAGIGEIGQVVHKMKTQDLTRSTPFSTQTARASLSPVEASIPGTGTAADPSAVDWFSPTMAQTGGIAREDLPQPSENDFFQTGKMVDGKLMIANVPMVDQEDDTSCGEAAFAMGWDFHHPNARLDTALAASVAREIGVYFPAELPGPGGYLGTSPGGMVTLADFFAETHGYPKASSGTIDLSRGASYAQQEAQGLLYSALLSGNPVIIDATDRLGRPSTAVNDSHYIVITGMDFTHQLVWFNDPLLAFSMSGTVLGYARSASWSDVWASWSKNRDILPGVGGHPGRGWYLVVH
jgi:hypothetical protein